MMTANTGTVLVVGAGSGIGYATATHLWQNGWQVIAADRDTRGLDLLVEHTRGGIVGQPLDVLDDLAVADAVRRIDAATPLDALINTVGINPDAGTASHKVDLNVFDQVYRVNLRAAFLLSQLVLPGMLERGYGRIAHVASIAGKEGNPMMASYSATKAGLIGLVKVLGREYARSGVTVNALAPAVIQTPLVDATSPEVVEAMLSKIPMGRTGTLTEAAALLEFMISPACGFTTGATFDMSGGRATY